jgi:hypothetical protein
MDLEDVYLDEDHSELDDVLDGSFFNKTIYSDEEEVRSSPKYGDDYFRNLSDL